MPRIAVISSRQLFLGRDDSQITKPTDQGSYDYYHRYQLPWFTPELLLTLSFRHSPLLYLCSSPT